ncbi:shikimate kinase [Tenacibaculum sp. SZ-18]|uniref:shikimate kinase n=1 Tax=Tenacibaculum sp. SZ-18 TaxID=754423 RepID=UPI000C2CF541|nr:shikimate kinase [Tenacibaculum sp. SZ-18]AUC14868.1 shikimate kinase [Tenacibaculum sp. SZ-18]
MRIVLLGYMASGKSTIGKVLAEKLNLLFIDLDDYIENKFQKSISDIFNDEGEIFFRLQEHEAIKEILAKQDEFILSLGGGSPCYAGNMDLINSHEDVKSVYIKLSVNTIYNRLIAEKDHRPIVSKIPTDELEEFIAKHLFERSFFYEQAKIKLLTNNKSVKKTIEELEMLLL